MAKHLGKFINENKIMLSIVNLYFSGTHGCKSAYPTLEEANKARVDSKGSATVSDEKRGEVSEKNDTASEIMDTDDEKETKESEANSNEVTDNENSEAETEKKEEGETDKDEKQDEDDDKEPGPGGLLFGTFYNNMEKNKDDEGEGYCIIVH